MVCSGPRGGYLPTPESGTVNIIALLTLQLVSQFLFASLRLTINWRLLHISYKYPKIVFEGSGFFFPFYYLPSTDLFYQVFFMLKAIKVRSRDDDDVPAPFQKNGMDMA